MMVLTCGCEVTATEPARIVAPCVQHGRIGLRDHFAAQALNGIMTREGWIGYIGDKKHRAHVLNVYVTDAYALADAMLKERAK